MWPFFGMKGPAKSVPVFVKGGLGVTSCCGSCPIICLSVVADAFLQVMQLQQTDQTSRLAPMMWRVVSMTERKRVGPEWRRDRCLEKTRR